MTKILLLTKKKKNQAFWAKVLEKSSSTFTEIAFVLNFLSELLQLSSCFSAFQTSHPGDGRLLGS